MHQNDDIQSSCRAMYSNICMVHQHHHGGQHHIRFECHVISLLVSVPHFFIWIWLTNSTMDDCRRKIFQPLNIRRKRDINKFVWNSSVKFYLNWFEFEKSNLNGSFFWWNLFWRHFQEASLSHKLKSQASTSLSTLHNTCRRRPSLSLSLARALGRPWPWDPYSSPTIHDRSTQHPLGTRHGLWYLRL